MRDNTGCRMNCNVPRSIRLGYFKAVIRYCWDFGGWRYLITDTFRRIG